MKRLLTSAAIALVFCSEMAPANAGDGLGIGLGILGEIIAGGVAAQAQQQQYQHSNIYCNNSRPQQWRQPSGSGIVITTSSKTSLATPNDGKRRGKQRLGVKLHIKLPLGNGNLNSHPPT